MDVCCLCFRSLLFTYCCFCSFFFSTTYVFCRVQGSKGGVAVALGLYDVTMAFVNCHMASKKVLARRQQYMDLIDRCGCFA